MRHIFYFLLLSILAFACNLEQEIELDLPNYEEKIIVEAYLDAGQPYQLLLTRSSSYFAPFPTNIEETFSQLLVNDAEVYITHRGNTVQLNNTPGINPLTGKLFNYAAPETAVFDTIEPYELEIILPDGSTIESSTRFLPIVPIDSVVVQFRKEENSEVDSARVLTYFNDRPNEDNYFRRTLFAYRDGSLETLQDFTTDDRFAENLIVFGTAYEFAPGDTVLNRIYHIEETYYNFLTSLQLAVAANGNPFGQPSPVIPGVRGTAENAIGIFTTLNYAEEQTILEK
ncbi:MAG TPA: DUF4249 domain-containing protein [Saprospiraceae bacterium]|nr:DUF4249 domain-containing protein [Saprospiraceae bacterium]